LTIELEQRLVLSDEFTTGWHTKWMKLADSPDSRSDQQAKHGSQQSLGGP
jgi:hypothetical protein